jgi:hypothetical protein
MTEMTPRERARFDAQAGVEAWSFALGVLRPWVQAAEAIGSEELLAALDLCRR